MSKKDFTPGFQKNIMVVKLGSSKALTERRKSMEAYGMTEKEQATILMDKFIDLQRIKAAEDREKEILYQIKTTKAKLEALGIVTEDLNID